MSRPRLSPRLSDLDPEEVARDVVAAVRAHLQHLSFGLAPAFQWHEVVAGDSFSTLGTTAADLTRYAQVGELGDWTEPDGPLDALQSICAALYSCAGEGGFGIGDLEEQVSAATVSSGERGDAGADPTAIGLVLVGAYARVQLAQRGSVLSARQLAALAGMSPQAVRALERRGELSLSGGGVPRADARRWLGARGVLGIR